MKFDEFIDKVLELMPDAVIASDNEGQLIIYTNLKKVGDDKVIPFDKPNLTGV